MNITQSLPGSYIAVSNIPQTGSTYHAEPLSVLFPLCKAALQGLLRYYIYNDRIIRVHPCWIRDYVLSLKAFRYTETDVTSFPELLLDNQTDKGFFYEIMCTVTDMHSGVPMRVNELGEKVAITPPECRKVLPGGEFGLCRLQLEADIEYLMVEGAYLIWQTTGNDDFLRQNLPRLEKGLAYMMSDPLRWDETYQLAKRPRTLDSWDFLDRKSSGYDRQIRPDDPMGIFHGDNTGLYYALTLMAKMYRQIGDDDAAKRSEETAAALRERIMKYLWTGNFFRHFLPLDKVDYGVDETYQMSLSNSYALTREILTFDEKLKVINSYRAMREKYKGELDDFRNLEPPYPKFYGMGPGEYVNGANAPFVAGQLSVAAFQCGMEDYGVDILKRIGRKVSADGKFVFLYNWQNQDIGGGPRCWSGAEIMNAMTTGLAGVVDNGKLFRNVVISPRFAAAGEKRSYVRLEYMASGAATEYEFSGDYDNRQLGFILKSSHAQAQLRMFVPGVPTAATVNGAPAAFEEQLVGASHYAVLPVAQGDRVQIAYRPLE